LRIDHEERQEVSKDLEESLSQHVIRQLGVCDVLLISDYAKGVCTPGLLGKVLSAAKRQHVPVLVDPAPRANYGRYRAAELLLPNRREAEQALGTSIRTPQDAWIAGWKLCVRYDLPAMLVKLDRDGMVLVQPAGGSQWLSTVPRRVQDVTGGGDMVLAVAGLCRAAEVPWEQAAALANVAAGLEVERLGVTPVTRAEIILELWHQERHERGKYVTQDEMTELAKCYRRTNQRVVFTNGCFDLLHAGHVLCLQEAACRGDVLVVAVNNDRSVRRLKGEGRPIIPEADRLALVAALECVTHVLLFDEETPHELLWRIRPDVLVKGGTYSQEQVVGREVVEEYGGQVCITKKRADLSTTGLLKTLRNMPVRPMANGLGIG